MEVPGTKYMNVFNIKVYAYLYNVHVADFQMLNRSTIIDGVCSLSSPVSRLEVYVFSIAGILLD